MKKILTSIFLLSFAASFSQTPQQLEANRVHLPNGWSLTPAGKSIPLGD